MPAKVRGFFFLHNPLVFLSVFLSYSAASPWRVDPDNIQVAEVDAFFIIPAVTGAAFGPGAVRMWSLSWQLCPL